MKRITFLLLSVISVGSFAGSYVDNGAESNPQNNKDAETHFYIDLGVNEYYFNQPGTSLPLSVGYGDPYGGTPYPSTSGSSYDADNWAVNPTITLGYQFLTDNADLQKIFGQQNAVELRAAYFHNSGTQDANYNDGEVNQFFITGADHAFFPASDYMTTSSMDFDNTYADIGLYYTGNKVINNELINSPYIGIDFAYLKQNSNYTADSYQNPGDYSFGLTVTDGSNDLSSYYMGVAFGDKLTWLFAKNYGVYGKLGAGVYLEHTKLDATQTPVNNVEVFDESLNQTYSVNTTDDQVTFKAQAEIGINYYFKNNQDQMSPRITLLAGLDYWNDVAYADNPTQTNEQVAIAYTNSVNPYAGVQVHIPL